MDKVNPKIYRFGSRVSIPDGGGRRIPTVCARNRASGFTAGAATGRPLPLAWERRMPPLASNELDPNGQNLVRQWIKSLHQ